MVDDVLRIERAEHVVFVLLHDAVGKGAELLVHPRARQRLEGLGLRCRERGKVMIPLRAQVRAHADTLTVHAVRGFKPRRLHLHQVRHQVLGAGGGAGVVEQLHGQAGDHLRHGHGLEVRLAAGRHIVGRFAHDGQRLLGEVSDHRAVILARDEVRDLPVRQRDVLGQNVRNAAHGQPQGRAGDDVQVTDDERRRLHGDGLFLSVDDDRADIGREAVGTRQRRHRDKRDAEMVGRVAAEVHDRAGADRDDDVRMVELAHHVLDHALFGVQAIGVEDDLLVGAHMLERREVVGVRIVNDGALAGQADLVHVLVELVERVIFHDDLLRLQCVLAAAAARADIFAAIENHANIAPILI